MVGVTKKASLILAVIFGFAVFFSGCKSDYAKKKIKLSAKINRGDCGGISRIDRKLGFGNSYEFRILPSFCRYVKEISVKTDKGTWNFTFARK
ncbi:hypothetical protein ACLGBM_00695 [Helicobacter pylori]